MRISPFPGKTSFTLFFLALALLVSLALAILLSGHAFAEVPNNAPDFGATTATRSVDENTSSYTSIGAPVIATDADQDDLVYSIQNGAKTHFGIDSATGQLWVGNKLDYERETSFSVVVVATDPDGDSDSITVTITVTDVEEKGKVETDWRRAQVEAEITASISDPDGGVTGVTWQWSVSDDIDGTFSDISSATSASYTPTANEASKFLKATATYTDRRGSGKEASLDPAISVRAKPASNSPPVLSPRESFKCGDDYCNIIYPYYPVGSYIYNPISVADDDVGDSHILSISGPDAAHFEIINEQRHLHGDLLTKESLDYTKSQYEVHITATDLSGAEATMTLYLNPFLVGGETNVPVTTIKGIDTYPTTSRVQLDYYENGTWLVADLDSARRGGAQLAAWEISGDDGAYFTIDSDGILNFRKPPDYDAPSDADGNNGYSFQVIPDTGLTYESSRIDLTVQVHDVSDGTSVRGPDRVSFEENAADAIGTYTAPSSQTLTLFGADADDFRLDGNGELTFVNPPDYETPTDSDGDNVYEVFVGVTPEDDNVKARCVLVSVTDIDEDITLTGKASPIDHYENDTNAVDKLTAFDPQGGSFAWTISGVDRDDFRLDQSGASSEYANLFFDPSPDYEDPNDDDGDNHYEITLVATASGNNSTRELEINVLNVNEPPVFTRGEFTKDFVEGGTSVVEDYDAEDPEGESVSWSLKGADTDDLEIDAATGELSFKTAPDYDQPSNASNVYVVDLVATDQSSQSASKTVTVNVTPVDEPPEITYNGNTGTQTILFDENDTSAVGTFVATDHDSNTIT